jgi:hypothetical protein
MDSVINYRYQDAMVSIYYPDTSFLENLVIPDGTEQSYPGFLTMLNSGRVFVVNSRRRNGLILFKRYHAEFAGPGAAVGGDYDRDCLGVLPIGNLSLLTPETHEERQKAYLIRRQWIRLIKQITENSVAAQRVQKILEQFEQYFPSEMVSRLPDEAFAFLVGVLPQTAAIVRRSGSYMDGKYNY